MAASWAEMTAYTMEKMLGCQSAVSLVEKTDDMMVMMMDSLTAAR
jgi:putative hemolysin